MIDPSVQELCDRGQRQLMETLYLEAERTFETAEKLALTAGDWDALSRLYLPLQEARRQRRQRSGEGIVRLDLVAADAADQLDARHVLENYPHGQLLVAGWGTIEPAIQVRAMAKRLGLYAETFLASVFPLDAGEVVVIVPTQDTKLPGGERRTLENLQSLLPPGCLIIPRRDLPVGPRPGTYQTFGHVMDMWELLHGPFLAAADAEPDLGRQIEKYRQTIGVDYACELAHQNLSAVARRLDRLTRRLD